MGSRRRLRRRGPATLARRPTLYLRPGPVGARLPGQLNQRTVDPGDHRQERTPADVNELRHHWHGPLTTDLSHVPIELDSAIPNGDAISYDEQVGRTPIMALK